ncbi:MAG: transposase family protein [Bacteroidetes bacterium]|nr:transposase family protein [Bacteroidota bacterium]
MEALKFFVAKESALSDLDLFVHTDLMIRELHIVKKTLQNGLRNNRIGQTTFYSHLEYPDGVYVRYSSVPKNSLLRQHLPLTSGAAYELLKDKKECEEILFKTESQRISLENMKKFYLERWPVFVSHYIEDFMKKSERQRYAQCHALFSYIIELERKGETLKNLFESFKKISYDELSRGYKIVFSTQNYKSFARKINEAKRIGIHNALIHKSKGVKRMDLAILSEDDRNWIRDKKANQNNYTYRTIQGILLEERGVYASLETLKKVFSGIHIKNLVKNFWKGPSYVRKNCRPTVKRIFNFPGDQYQADGSKVQFVCIDHTRKIVTLTYYVVLDAYSRKVVGLSVDTSENTEMVISAFKYAFMIVGYLPREIVVDNGPAYGSKESEKFIANIKHFGVVWRFCHKDYPLEKAEIESFFSVFQKVICNKYPYYIGEGIKTKNEYGNPSTDLIKKYWKQKHSLMSKTQLTELLFKMIKEYNNEYYKETIEPLNEISGESSKEHDSIGAVHDFKALLA